MMHAAVLHVASTPTFHQVGSLYARCPVRSPKSVIKPLPKNFYKLMPVHFDLSISDERLIEGNCWHSDKRAHAVRETNSGQTGSLLFKV